MDFIKKKAYGQITISNVVDGQDGQSAINIVLGNESQNIPCTNNGTISEQLLIDISFSGYLGTKKVPASAVVGLLPSGVTLATNTNSTSTKDGLIQLNIAKGSNLGGNNIINGKIKITFTVEKQQVIKDFTWCKTKDGAEGSMIIYELISSTPVLNKEFNNSIKPNTITFQSFFRKSNNTTKNPYNGMFIIKESTNGGATYKAKYTSAINENSKTYTLSSNTVTHLQCILCEANKISNQLDVVTVPVLSDDSIKNEISKVVSTVSGVSTKVDAVDKKIIDKIWQTDITTQINNYDGNTVKNIRDQITEQTKEIGKVTTKVSDVESTFSNGLSSLTERVAKNEQDANGFKQTVEKNYATKNELGETSSTIRSEMSQTAETINQKVSSLDGAVSQHTQTLSTVTTELKSAQDDITRVEQTTTSVKTEVENARGDKTSLNLRIEGIQTVVKDNEKNISSLNQTTEGFNTRIENAEGSITDITEMAGTIQESVSNIDGRITDVETKAGTIETNLSDANGKIAQILEDAEIIKSDLKDTNEKIGTSVEQTAKEFNIKIKEIQDGLNETVYKNFVFDNNGLTISAPNSNISLRVDNTGINFYNGQSLVAYINSNKLHIADATIVENLQLGDFGFTQMSNGSLTFGKL